MHSILVPRVVALATAAILVLGCNARVPAPPQVATTTATVAASDWPQHGRTHAEQRFSPLAQINVDNVDRLGLAWSYQMRESRGVQATPLVIDGVMYVTSAWSIVHALNAATGEELWVFDPEVDRSVGAKTCCDAVNRGVAYLDGRVFVAALDGRLIALDARSGAMLWETQTIDDPSELRVITGAPRAAKGLVFIGNSGADLGVRGYMGAYHADTGQLAWRFYTVPGNPADGPDNAASDAVLDRMTATWTGEWWRDGGGGTVWDSITYDPEFDRVYIGVGNGAPWNHQIRSPNGGDNLFLASIVALDRATGKYLWHYQATPADTWDATATQQMTLATLTIDGRARKVLMQAPKNGFFYVIDRVDGKLISAGNIVPMAKAADTPPGQPISWAYGIDLATGRPLENPEARYLNGATAVVHPVGLGAHGWQPQAFSPETGYVYLSVQDFASTFKTDPNYKLKPYLRASGIEPPIALPRDPAIRAAIPQRVESRLIAWDPVAQQEAWRVPFDYAGNGGVLATAGDLIFHGQVGGEFVAYAARTGKALWSFDAQSTAQGGPVSYAVDGEQYVAIAVGNGGSAYLAGAMFVPEKLGPAKGRVLAFKLGASSELPPFDSSYPPVPEPPVVKVSPDDLAIGTRRFHEACIGCHGFSAISGMVTPDLRRSAFIHNAEAFRAVVKAGALLPAGMPNFPWMSDEAIEGMRAFLAGEARYLHAQQAKRAMRTKSGEQP